MGKLRPQLCIEPVLGHVYTMRQRCDNALMMLAILYSLKTVEWLENGFQLHSGAIPLFQ